MSAFILVFAVVVVISCITILSRRNVNRFLRQRKTMAILLLARRIPDK